MTKFKLVSKTIGQKTKISTGVSTTKKIQAGYQIRFGNIIKPHHKVKSTQNMPEEDNYSTQ